MKTIAEIQKFIKNVLDENDLKPSWIKKRLPHIDIYYLLKPTCKRFDAPTLEEIRDLFKKHGFITSENERTEKYMRQLTKITAMVESTLGLLNETSYEFAESEDLIDFNEKLKLNEILNKLERNTATDIHTARKILGLI
jgi:hypothetical protein